MFEHIAAAIRAEQKEMQYRAYITEALRILTENSSNYLVPGVGEVKFGSYMKATWIQLAKESEEASRKPQEDDTRTGDEIAADVITRLSLHFQQGGEIDSDEHHV